MEENKPQQEKNPYKKLCSWMSFSWICLKCCSINNISYASWEAQKGLTECNKCERAYMIKTPWNE